MCVSIVKTVQKSRPIHPEICAFKKFPLLGMCFNNTLGSPSISSQLLVLSFSRSHRAPKRLGIQSHRVRNLVIKPQTTRRLRSSNERVCRRYFFRTMGKVAHVIGPVKFSSCSSPLQSLLLIPFAVPPTSLLSTDVYVTPMRSTQMPSP